MTLHDVWGELECTGMVTARQHCTTAAVDGPALFTQQHRTWHTAVRAGRTPVAL